MAITAGMVKELREMTGNDDAIRAVKLIVSKMADAVIEAKQGAEEEVTAEEASDETVEE